jgi:transposase
MAYSMDLRERVLGLYDDGKQTAQVAQQLKVSPAWARRVKQHRHEPSRKIGGSEPKLDEQAQAMLWKWIDEKPDATLEQLQKRVQQDLGLSVSIGCLWNTLRRMKLTFKKSR